MTKFKDFLDKYDVQLTEKNSKKFYGKFIKWKNGDILSPNVYSVSDFYDIFKGDIEFNEKELYDCFKLDSEVDKYELPFILGIEGGLNREYSYLFVNYLLKNIKSNIRVLVLDEARYDHIYNALERPYSDTFEILELTNIKEEKNKILKSNYRNIDYSCFSMYEDINEYSKSINKISLELFNDLKHLKQYDLILFNYREFSPLENICSIIRQVSDQLYFIGFHNKCEKDYSYLRKQTNNLEMLTSELNFRLDYIVKKNKNFIMNDYWIMSREITGEALEVQNNYVSILTPRIFKDLKNLYIKFYRTCNFKGFKKKNYFSKVSSNFF